LPVIALFFIAVTVLENNTNHFKIKYMKYSFSLKINDNPTHKNKNIYIDRNMEVVEKAENLNRIAIIYFFVYPLDETLQKIVNDLLNDKIISRNVLKICKDRTQNISWLNLLSSCFNIN
jgi:hypothetical protein